MNNRARITFLFIAPFCLSLVSCSRKHLPPISNSTALRNDCTLLYQQSLILEIPTNEPEHSLGLRKIPEDRWPNSVASLHPYLVCSDRNGIQIWIAIGPPKNGTGDSAAYYIPVSTESPLTTNSSRFVFTKTPLAGIYELRQTPWF